LAAKMILEFLDIGGMHRLPPAKVTSPFADAFF
jgi:hypothetical protein